MTLYIKNMVCIRCKMIVKSELEKMGMHKITVGIHIFPVLSIAAILKGLIKDKELLYLRKNLTWKIQE